MRREHVVLLIGAVDRSRKKESIDAAGILQEFCRVAGPAAAMAMNRMAQFLEGIHSLGPIRRRSIYVAPQGREEAGSIRVDNEAMVVEDRHEHTYIHTTCFLLATAEIPRSSV